MHPVKLTVAKRLALAFGVLILFLAVTVALGIHLLRASDEAARSLYEDGTLTLRHLGTFGSLAMRDRILLGDGVAHYDKARAAQRLADYAADRATAQAEWKAFAAAPMSAEEAALVRDVKATMDAYVDQGLGLVAAALAAERFEEATSILDKAVDAQTAPPMQAALATLMAYQVRQGQQTFDRAAGSNIAGMRAMLALGAFALLAGIAAASVITQHLNRQLGAEPGALAAMAQRIAGGDLTSSGRADEVPGSVMASMEAMRRSLDGVVTSVRDGVGNVATASSQIARGNLDLSGRTEQQVSSLRQTASSTEQLSGTIKTTAGHANQANELAVKATGSAREGGDMVTRVVATMADIQASSRQIAEIIGVIDGIAFQTNILALNAAVEAARAGEQGRGFAVVASEVRSLAGRSAEAARQIKSLIAASVERVEAGASLVAGAGRTMTQIVEQVDQVSDLIAHITTASLQQSQGVVQIDSAMQQLDQTTQQNAALVEEAAAAAGSLHAQADRLTRSVAAFRTSAG